MHAQNTTPHGSKISIGCPSHAQTTDGHTVTDVIEQQPSYSAVPCLGFNLLGGTAPSAQPFPSDLVRSSAVDQSIQRESSQPTNHDAAFAYAKAAHTIHRCHNALGADGVRVKRTDSLRIMRGVLTSKLQDDTAWCAAPKRARLETASDHQDIERIAISGTSDQNIA